MPVYRFYTITKNGHIDQPPVTRDLPNDKAAHEKAKQVLDGHDIEIWQAARLVAYLVPDKER
jgi:hypothetical protein